MSCNYIISKFANLAIRRLFPTLSKLISTFRSSPSGSVFVIVPSPNFLWKTLTPSPYCDKSTLVLVVFFPKLLKKLSAVLPKEACFPNMLLATATPLSTVSFILYDFIVEAFLEFP